MVIVENFSSSFINFFRFVAFWLFLSWSNLGHLICIHLQRENQQKDYKAVLIKIMSQKRYYSTQSHIVYKAITNKFNTKFSEKKYWSIKLCCINIIHLTVNKLTFNKNYIMQIYCTWLFYTVNLVLATTCPKRLFVYNDHCKFPPSDFSLLFVVLSDFCLTRPTTVYFRQN